MKKMTEEEFRNSMTEHDLYECLYTDPSSIKNIENPSEGFQLMAVKQRSKAIKYIENPSEKVQLKAVKRKPMNIKYIKNPTKKVQTEAIKRNYAAIVYIENPDEEIQLTAMEWGGGGIAIKYIKDPCEAAQIMAVERGHFNLVKNPPESVQFIIINQHNNVKDLEYIKEKFSHTYNEKALEALNNKINILSVLDKDQSEPMIDPRYQY